MAQRSPIVPIVANVLGFGIPAIAEAVERGKARREARRVSDINAEAEKAGAEAASGLGAMMVAGGTMTGVVDQLGIGAQIMSEMTHLPVELLPDHAPTWVQVAYVAVTVIGFALRQIAPLLKPKN
jgi:hypothetical protein